LDPTPVSNTPEALTMRIAMLCLAGLVGLAAAHAVPSVVDQVSDQVYMVYDDTGSWGGMTMGITHQNSSTYQAKKILDLSDVPQAVWDQTKAVRLSLYFMVHDYSWHDLPQANGLDEAFQIVVNNDVHELPTHCGAPVYLQGKPPAMAWWDVAIPKDILARGVNWIVVRKAPGKPDDPQAKSDDYLYLGIDNSRQRDNSCVSFDGTNFTHDKLTVPGGNGEYMIRMYLLTGETRFTARWQPGQQPPVAAPDGLVLYAGAHHGSPSAEGLKLGAGQTARMEWRAGALDALEPATVTVAATGPAQVAWLDEHGATAKDPAFAGLKADLGAARQFQPSGVLITAGDSPVTIQSVTLAASRAYHPVPLEINMAPIVTAPAKPPAAAPPSLRGRGNQLALTGGLTQAIFERGETLRLTSLRNLISGTEMLRRPDEVALFVIEVGDKRYVGSRDFKIDNIRMTPTGFVCALDHQAPDLRGVLEVAATDEGLRLGLNVVNTGTAPLDFKVTFPHLAGLGLSDKPADDYYFYPFGGGIIAPVAAKIRHGYGDYEAMYQVMDLFSPSLGCGMYVRADDSAGWHKTMSLRKSLPDSAPILSTNAAVDRLLREEYRPMQSLEEAVEGTSLAFDYARRTRAPLAQAVKADPTDAASLQQTANFAPAAVVIACHPGDWHTAMERYAAWAHQVWKFRPYPSRLKSIRNMDVPGWGQNILFRDGAYRTDFIRPRTECVELMSWWEWSPLGPFKTPFDKLDTVLTPAEIKRWQPYFVKDPVTGQMMWNNQPGDYKGYNERFGGLPAFQKAIQTYQDMGVLVTLYTDPFRLDSNNEIGGKYGEQWGVVGPDGKRRTGYEVWNPCHNLAAVREWVAETMGRVMRETKADGIRLDEYGHRGWACYDDTHKHTYQEPGVTEWNKAVAEATKLIHAEMDQVRPDLVLTTEHPGHDYLLQYLEGCITYDLSSMASPLRPLECNAQRFYFPECKPYELDHRGMDPLSRKKFWNAEESFERDFPLNMDHVLRENEDVYQGRDFMPLCPTLQLLIYANRFSGAGKTLYHLYNATGHTFEGPVLRVGASVPDAHAIELLSGQALPIVDGKVSLYLERDDVACVAVLPMVLEVGANGQVTIKDSKGGTLVLAAADGKELLRQDATGKTATLELSKLPAGTKPVCLKLLRNGQLVDAVTWPGGAE
jgi:hypothetical protein